MEWSNFPMKSLILGYLDLDGRCNLRACSKADLELVDSAKYVPEKIKIREIESDMDREKSIIRLDIDSFTIWFIGKNEKTGIERAWNEEVMEMSETKNENRFDVFRRFINRFLKNGTFESRVMSILGPSFDAEDHWTIKTSELAVASREPVWVMSWLSKVAPATKLKKLEVFGPPLLGIARLDLIYDVTEKLELNCVTDLTDEHLDRITAKSLQMDAEGTTPEGVKRALERFLRHSDPGHNFQMVSNFPENFDPTTLIPEDVKFEKMNEEQGEHCYKLGAGGVHVLYFFRSFVRVFHVEKQRRRGPHNYTMWPF